MTGGSAYLRNGGGHLSESGTVPMDASQTPWVNKRGGTIPLVSSLLRQPLAASTNRTLFKTAGFPD